MDATLRVRVVRASLAVAAALIAMLAAGCGEREPHSRAAVSGDDVASRGTGAAAALAAAPGDASAAPDSATPAAAALGATAGTASGDAEPGADAPLMEADSADPGAEEDASTLELVERIPLREGLIIVTAIADQRGDYESIKRVTGLSSAGVRIDYSAEAPDMIGQLKRVDVQRLVTLEDLRTARAYVVVFGEDEPELRPGTTTLGVSTAVLQDLRSTGRANIRVIGTPDLASAVFAMLTGLPEFEGELERVDTQAVRVPVLLNGRRVALPAIHASGTLNDGIQTFDAEFFFLDDPDNPLSLRFRIGPTSLRAVKITASDEGATLGDLERALEEEGRAEVYGIYFSFNSAEIRPESAPVLDEVADILRRHPDWRLRVDGHTDAVGGAAANLALSRRRAEAVKRALVERLGGGEDRLQARGFGESRPRASNATLDGRAQNRRVELVRF